MSNAPSPKKSAIISGAEVLELNPFEVDIPSRVGFLHEDKAAALGRLMAVDGQRDPCKVTRNKAGRWQLVTGMHRLMGARAENIHILALEVAGKPEDLVDLEASENLHRRPLGPLERAKFTAALVRAAQERIARAHGGLKQEQMAAKARWEKVKAGEVRTEQALKDDTEDACAKIAHAYGWEESVGEALGMSRRTIHNDLKLSRLIIEPFPDLVEELSRHPVVGENGSQLKAIADVKNENDRRCVIEALLRDTELSADEARVQTGIDKETSGSTDGGMKLLSRAISTLERMPKPERFAFVEEQVFQLPAKNMRAVYERLAIRFAPKGDDNAG